MGLTGCATVENQSAWQSLDELDKWADKRDIEIRKKVADERFKDSYNGLKIISENYDLYIETMDGKDKRRITNTPDVKETWAFFTKDGKSVIYQTTDSNFTTERYFIQPIDKDDGSKEEMSDGQYSIFHQERHPEVYNF